MFWALGRASTPDVQVNYRGQLIKVVDSIKYAIPKYSIAFMTMTHTTIILIDLLHILSYRIYSSMSIVYKCMIEYDNNTS